MNIEYLISNYEYRIKGMILFPIKIHNSKFVIRYSVFSISSQPKEAEFQHDT
jgi:hypothetical protein